MSENIRGITFAEQAVTPADDAIVRRAILGDGILTGCDVSYSGSTLTMAAGYIIACGRAFQITAAQNWAVVDATSGFARLLVTLDLTKTATEEAFSQIEFSLEYAASEDGFLALVQEDINLSGAKYQIVAAVVSLGTGGITGIVSKLERAEGGGLNFKVVAGLTQPVSATENTIWVKTEKMTGWIFDANQPENLTEGMVWIKVGTKNAVKFNALKKNGIQVYPISAKQYVSGALVDRSAEIYQSGSWKPWIEVIEFNESAWTKKNPYPSRTYTMGTYDFSSKTLKGTVNDAYQHAVVVKNDRLDFSAAKYLKFNYSLDKNISGQGAILVKVSSSNSDPTDSSSVVDQQITSVATNQEVSIPVSTVNGSYYVWIGLAMWGSVGTVNFEVSNLHLSEV